MWGSSSHLFPALAALFLHQSFGFWDCPNFFDVSLIHEMEKARDCQKLSEKSHWIWSLKICLNVCLSANIFLIIRLGKWRKHIPILTRKKWYMTYGCFDLISRLTKFLEFLFTQTQKCRVVIIYPYTYKLEFSKHTIQRLYQQQYTRTTVIATLTHIYHLSLDYSCWYYSFIHHHSDSLKESLIWDACGICTFNN